MAYERSTSARLRDILEAVDRAASHFRGDLQASDFADLRQAVFVRMTAALKDRAHVEVSELAAYAITSLRNAWIDERKRRRREIPRLNDADTGSPSSPPDGRQPDLEGVHVYLLSLPADLRDVYRARFVVGLTQAEAASTLDLSRQQLRTIETRLLRGAHRALAAYRAALRDLTRGCDS